MSRRGRALPPWALGVGVAAVGAVAVVLLTRRSASAAALPGPAVDPTAPAPNVAFDLGFGGADVFADTPYNAANPGDYFGQGAGSPAPAPAPVVPPPPVNTSVGTPAPARSPAPRQPAQARTGGGTNAVQAPPSSSYYAAVDLLQQRLRTHGYAIPTSDNNYSAATRLALTAFLNTHPTCPQLDAIALAAPSEAQLRRAADCM